ncbi:tryptophan 2,3-dioxygenase-like [Styela clava]
MTCPYFSPARKGERRPSLLERVEAQEGYLSIHEESDMNYGKYLGLDKLLSSQELRSGSTGLTPIHDEHLFIIVHQTFELWFKQMLHEINSVRTIFMSEYLEERNSLTVISRINRVIAILKLCTEQFTILETMTPQDFLDFRDFLEGGSGFQSFQFRMLEIRLGVKNELRVAYNRNHFLEVFFGDERKSLETAMKEPSLLDLVNYWLERTPGLKRQTFDFWKKFRCSVEAMLDEMKAVAEDESDLQKKENLMWEYKRKAKNFSTIFDENLHNDLLKKDERRFTYHALQGALMIFFYRDEPRFHLPFQLLHSLMDVDNYLMKFRYNHACMVQRMVGSKVGTGGSSGYQYLRSTCSDRYKIFLDLLNMATYLVPRDRIPPLTSQMKRSLSVHDADFLQLPLTGLYEERDSGCQPGNGSVYSYPDIAEEDVDSEVGSQVETNKGRYETVV